MHGKLPLSSSLLLILSTPSSSVSFNSRGSRSGPDCRREDTCRRRCSGSWNEVQQHGNSDKRRCNSASLTGNRCKSRSLSACSNAKGRGKRQPRCQSCPSGQFTLHHVVLGSVLSISRTVLTIGVMDQSRRIDRDDKDNLLLDFSLLLHAIMECCRRTSGFSAAQQTFLTKTLYLTSVLVSQSLPDIYDKVLITSFRMIHFEVSFPKSLMQDQNSHDDRRTQQGHETNFSTVKLI